MTEAGANTRETEEIILSLFGSLRRERKQRLNENNKGHIQSDLASDISYFQTDAFSELTGESEQEKFHKKWDKIIQSGMQQDITFLNPMAHKMLPKDDIGLLTVKRLKKELSELSAFLPASQQGNANISSNHALSKLGVLPGGGRRTDIASETLKKAIHDQHKILKHMKLELHRPLI